MRVGAARRLRAASPLEPLPFAWLSVRGGEAAPGGPSFRGACFHVLGKEFFHERHSYTSPLCAPEGNGERVDKVELPGLRSAAH